MLCALILVAGCGSSGPETQAASSAGPSVQAKRSGPTEAQWKKARQAAGIPEKPKPKQRTAFLAALVAIDPNIVHGKPDKAIDRGRNQCSSVKNWPKNQAKLVKLTNARFTSPDHPEGFGTVKSALILKAVRRFLCPTF
jgi:hypothetical protein